MKRFLSLVICWMTLGYALPTIVLAEDTLPPLSKKEQLSVSELQTRLLDQIDGLTDENFEVAYAKVKKEVDDLNELGQVLTKILDDGTKPPTLKITKTSPGDFRAWLRRYVKKDLPLFLKSLLSTLPTESRAMVSKRMANLPRLSLQISDVFRYEGRTDFEKHVVILSPHIIESYEKMRDVFSHELVHWIVQGRDKGPEERSAQHHVNEGVTEYLTVAATETVGWTDALPAYQDETALASICSLWSRDQILTWYATDGTSLAEFSESVLDSGIRYGLPEKELTDIVFDWREKRFNELTLRYGDSGATPEEEKKQSEKVDRLHRALLLLLREAKFDLPAELRKSNTPASLRQFLEKAWGDLD